MSGIAKASAFDPEIRTDKPLDFALIKRLFAYTRPYTRTRNWLIVIVLVRSVQLPMLAAVIGAIIDGPIADRSVRGVIWGAAIFLMLAVFTQVTFIARSLMALRLGEWVVRDLRMDLFRHLQTLTMGFFHRTKAGRIISRITSDVDAVRIGVQDVLFVSLVQIGQMLVCAALMLYYNWLLFLAVLALVPVLYVINHHFRKRLSRSHRDIQESFSRVTSSLAESVQGIRVTQGFVRQDINAGLFYDLVADHSRYNIGLARVSGVFVPLLEFNSQAFIAAMLLIGGWQVLRPDPMVELGQIIQFFFLANLFFSPIAILGNQYNASLSAMAGAERIFRMLDTRPDWTDPPDAIALPPIEGRVEFRGVTFAYEPGRPVLHDLDFVARPGDTIALVGHTGCGKSTIINLISKFYLCDEGEVLIDGYDVKKVTSDSLHHQMGVVLQNNFLFTGTVMENIRVGRPGASDQQVHDALNKLDCMDLLEALPDGLQTVVGERGSGISLGQRQLICFARSMLADPRILILDEATSSVDTMTEVRIQKALDKLFEGRTSFVVAHRLSTVRHATRVLVLEEGRIIERGTHEQLLLSGGAYADLYRQFIRATEA
ncbi:MAG: ABC transporter ATP-binding protein [Phycisphaeraceae bacterium]|nr:ABC transporter ATP-binding protein [Phycisphaeraceae bacterium]